MIAPAKKGKPALIKAASIKPVDLSHLMAMADRMDEGFQRVLDRLTAMEPVPTAASPQMESGATLLAARHETLLTLITSKSAQQFFEDMLGTGAPPTLAQVNREIDRRMALR